MLPNNHSFLLHSSQSFSCPTDNNNNNAFTKRKRRPAGTPDPDAEVVYLSPEKLMESDRYICEICNQSFQREQNLQMHRRRHKVPWKLVKRDKEDVSKKRVYVCPEATCLHHDPSHALGDLVGIKKHFRRKHSNQKQFVCFKCSKGYAVQSDYKAHLKICGTKGHSCDCGRVFSRVESFIEHQDACKATTPNVSNSYFQESPPECMLQVSSSRSGYSGNSSSLISKCTRFFSIPHGQQNHSTTSNPHHNLELGLELFPSENHHHHVQEQEVIITKESSGKHEYNNNEWTNSNREGQEEMEVIRLRSEASQLMSMAIEHKALAEQKRQEAKYLFELAKQDMTNARKIREQVLGHDDELSTIDDSYAIFQDQDHNNATKSINYSHNNLVDVTCHACNKRSQPLILEGHPQPIMANISSAGKDNSHEGRKEGFLNWFRNLTSI